MKSRTHILIFIESRVYSRLPASKYKKLINYETCCATTMKINACEIFLFWKLISRVLQKKRTFDRDWPQLSSCLYNSRRRSLLSVYKYPVCSATTVKKSNTSLNCMFQKVHLSLFTVNSMLFRYCSQNKVVRSKFSLNLK